MSNKEALLHLSLIPQIGPASVLKIIRGLEKEAAQAVDLQSLYQYNKRDFAHNFGISQRIAHLLVNGLADKKMLEQEISLIEKYHVTTLSFLDKDYPTSLKQIYHPPLVIYCLGAPLESSAKRLAIVGSRKADSYARRSIKELVPPLIENNWEIVSGGASGVDSLAHEQTLQSKGKTIAVFGSGLTKAYPAQNRDLFRAIVKNGGTLVSPFALMTQPSKGNFPARNRIIAGLSKGCIVIQAADKSGALITSQFALDQGKQIFALPGHIDNELSLGCHKLIQQGAKLITNANDILEEFGEEVQTSVDPATKQALCPLLEHLNNPTTTDELATKTGLSFLDLQGQLFTLQIEGKIKQNLAGLWERAN